MSGRKSTGRLLCGGVDWNYVFIKIMQTIQLSPPLRRRGLKLDELNIEIAINVASFAEAWIETPLIIKSKIDILSPPLRRRGLKLPNFCFPPFCFSRLLCGGVDWNSHPANPQMEWTVASFAEAWIETFNCSNISRISASPPLRRRGLKPFSPDLSLSKTESPPLRRRGLKH